MRSTVNIFKHLKSQARNGAVVNYTRQDLTQKWLNRVQVKATNSASQDAYSKLSSLVDYFTKPSEKFNDKLDWEFWRKNIRTTGVVDKLEAKVESLKDQAYNAENLASKSAVTSEKHETYGLFLKYNHDLWMKHYVDNLENMYGILHLGDIDMISGQELFSYMPGINQSSAGWRETGYITRCK